MSERAVALRRSGAEAAPSAPACHAPFSSLYLDPTGRVTACCANAWHPLGDVRHQSLAEIWHGSAARELRTRLQRGDLDLGCELCAAEVARGASASAESHRFEGLGATTAEPEWPVQLELALSNACNLQCVMCNGELSSAIRVHREGRAALPAVYGDRFFAELDEFLPRLRRVFFLGGEPFLGAEPLRVLDRLVELGLAPEVYVTSNGTQWSPRVQRILASLPVDVSISVDGYRAETLEAIRVGVRQADLLRNIERYQEATRGNGGGFSLTFCLQRGNWRELGDVLAWGDRLDVLVGVSTLTNPPHLALHAMTTAELEGVARVLHAEDRRRRSALVRNQPAWAAALARVDGLLAERTGAHGDRADGDVGRVALAAEARATSWAGPTPVSRLVADGSQLVVGIEPDPRDVCGVDLSGMAGGPTRGLVDALRAALGPVESSTLTVHHDGVEERGLRFAGPAGTTEVRAWLAPTGPDGHVWLLAARPLGRGAGGAG